MVNRALKGRLVTRHRRAPERTIQLDEVVLTAKSGFNINNAVNALNLNALPLPGIGKCARYVRYALESGFAVKKDAYKALTPRSAKDTGAFLEQKGFRTVNTTTYQKGDIAIIQNYTGGSPHGHMQMYNGSQWVSDFKQNGFWPGSGYRTHKPKFSIFRW